MDLLVNKKSPENFIRKIIIDENGKSSLEKIKVKHTFYDNVDTYIMLDENLNPCLRIEKQWNEKEEKYDKIKMPVILTSHQVQAMKARGEQISIFTETTIKRHPTNVIKNLEKNALNISASLEENALNINASKEIIKKRDEEIVKLKKEKALNIDASKEVDNIIKKRDEEIIRLKKELAELKKK